MRLPTPSRRALFTSTVVLNCAAQVALAVITFLYLRETRLLTEHSAAQLERMKQEATIAHMPALVVAVVDVEERENSRRIGTDSKLTEEQRQADLARIKDQPHLFTCAVDNMGTQVAESIQVLIYDSSTKSFLHSETFFEMLAGNDNVATWVDQPRLSATEVVKKMTEYYGQDFPQLDEYLAIGETSYLAVMFKDVSGTIYLRKRPFTISKDKAITHHASEFFYWF